MRWSESRVWMRAQRLGGIECGAAGKRGKTGEGIPCIDDEEGRTMTLAAHLQASQIVLRAEDDTDAAVVVLVPLLVVVVAAVSSSVAPVTAAFRSAMRSRSSRPSCC